MKINTFLKVFLFSIMMLFFSGCLKEQKMKVAVTKASGSENYKKYALWIKNFEPDAEIIDLYKMTYQEALLVLDSCDGLILSGGPDVDPAKYGKAFDSAKCTIDLQRDSLEFEVIRRAKQKKIPILAVCRGLQIFNVAEGGSLVTDIPSYIESNVYHQIDSGDAYHKIKMIEGTNLYAQIQISDGFVNSNHHQAVDHLAMSLEPSAFTEDGIIEAFEYKDKSLPFMIAVQWHPERLNYNNPLSGNIAKEFINHIRLYKKNK
jgi:putative glutamine amidotransferase